MNSCDYCGGAARYSAVLGVALCRARACRDQYERKLVYGGVA